MWCDKTHNQNTWLACMPQLDMYKFYMRSAITRNIIYPIILEEIEPLLEHIVKHRIDWTWNSFESYWNFSRESIPPSIYVLYAVFDNVIFRIVVACRWGCDSMSWWDWLLRSTENSELTNEYNNRARSYLAVPNLHNPVDLFVWVILMIGKYSPPFFFHVPRMSIYGPSLSTLQERISIQYRDFTMVIYWHTRYRTSNTNSFGKRMCWISILLCPWHLYMASPSRRQHRWGCYNDLEYIQFLCMKSLRRAYYSIVLTLLWNEFDWFSCFQAQVTMLRNQTILEIA